MRMTCALLTVGVLSWSTHARADEPSAPSFTLPVTQEAPVLAPAFAAAPAGGVVMSSSQLRCDACVPIEIGGVALIGVGELGAGLHMLSIWTNPTHTQSDSSNATGQMMLAFGDAADSLLRDTVAVFELVPVGGPLLGVALESDPTIRRLLLVDAGVQAAGLATAVAGFSMERTWRARVTPLATRDTMGVVVAGNF